MDDSQLDPMDEALAPLAQSIGRAVMGAAALEKVLLVDIVNRMAGADGLREELEREVQHLERRPSGILLAKLKTLGLSTDLSSRIEAVVVRRNKLIHHYMEEPGVILALTTGEGIDELVAAVDDLALECQQIINIVGPEAFDGLQQALGSDIPQLIDAIQNLDPDILPTPAARQQLRTLQGIDLEQLRELFDDGSSGREADEQA